MSCFCNNGNCANINGCYYCTWNTGYNLTPGSLTGIKIQANTTGPYRVTASLVSGNPPSSYNVLLNGNNVATIPGTSGEAIVSGQAGDIIQVQVTWGYSYQGGEGEISICAPTIPSATPKPNNQTNDLTFAVIAGALGAAGALGYLLLKRRKEKEIVG